MKTGATSRTIDYSEGMNRQSAPIVLANMPLADRLQLIEDLWDSIVAEPIDALPLPDWHKTEVDRRLDALNAGSSTGASWEEVRRRITARP